MHNILKYNFIKFKNNPEFSGQKSRANVFALLKS